MTRVDAILFTHSHADHILGLDEVRRFNVVQGAAIPCFGDERTLADLRRTFAYIFKPPSDGGGIPQITLFRIGGPFMLGGLEITRCRSCTVLGRFSASASGRSRI